jgi:hypothetical protein
MRWAIVAGIIAICGAPVLGHHSFASFYLEDDIIDIEGEILEFEFKNPHSMVHVQSQDDFGRPKRYVAEWVGTSRLDRDGINRKTLSRGDVVRIWASPSRDPNDNRIHLKRIQRRADRWEWGQVRRENR